MSSIGTLSKVSAVFALASCLASCDQKNERSPASPQKAAIAGLGSEKPADGQEPYDGKPTPMPVSTPASAMCTGFHSDGSFVNYQINDDVAVLCSEQTTEEVQREEKFAHSCEAQKAKVTVCYCGLKVCSEDVRF